MWAVGENQSDVTVGEKPKNDENVPLTYFDATTLRNNKCCIFHQSIFLLWVRSYFNKRGQNSQSAERCLKPR